MFYSDVWNKIENAEIKPLQLWLIDFFIRMPRTTFSTNGAGQKDINIQNTYLYEIGLLSNTIH